MTKHANLFTSRQLVALTTFSDLVGEAREKMLQDGASEEYADAVATYLGLGVSRLADNNSSLVLWSQSRDQLVHTFGRQALPMVWDFAEANNFSGSAGDLKVTIGSITRSIDALSSNLTFTRSTGHVGQGDVISLGISQSALFSTDPPYYDAVPYADLSDFFYVWLCRSLGSVYPKIFSTLLVPKAQELVADPFRFGSSQRAKDFFENGLRQVFSRVRETANSSYLFTVYYAFKQAESDDESTDSQIALASTGWETMLEGLMQSGFAITGTLPMRTEKPGRLRDLKSNALASSIVLVCRPRPDTAPQTTRRDFLNTLKRELPSALKALQQGNIAPVDFAQACIGPGMAIFSRYASVLEANGTPMRVRTALQLINQALNEFLAEQEGEFDADTRWALAWFEQHQFEPAAYGIAETLSKAKNTSIQGLVEAGILEAKAGKVRLLKREEISDFRLDLDSNSANLKSKIQNLKFNDWKIAQQLIWALDRHGEQGAGSLLSEVSDRGEIARDLAYRLYNLCDRKGWTQEAISYNSLVIAWSEISRLASDIQRSTPIQSTLEF